MIHSSVKTIFVFRITGDVTAKTIVETGAMVLAKDNLEPVARSIVNAYREKRSIEACTFLWKKTLVSANHVSSNSGLVSIR